MLQLIIILLLKYFNIIFRYILLSIPGTSIYKFILRMLWSSNVYPELAWCFTNESIQSFWFVNVCQRTIILVVDLFHYCFIWESFCEGHLLTENFTIQWFCRMWTLYIMVLGFSPWDSLDLLIIQTKIIVSGCKAFPQWPEPQGLLNSWDLEPRLHAGLDLQVSHWQKHRNLVESGL